jgi:hypothetical protein
VIFIVSTSQKQSIFADINSLKSGFLNLHGKSTSKKCKVKVKDGIISGFLGTITVDRYNSCTFISS